MTNYIILDTETSGLRSPIKACEIAWIQVDENMNILDEQVHRTDPQMPMEQGAVDIHGITNEAVAGLPSNAEICALVPQPFVWIGHNCSYDMRVTGEHVVFNADVCTLALSRAWIKGTTNHKLATLQQELKLSKQQSHSAMGDCRTTYELLQLILKLSGRTLPALVELESKPKMIQRMPFGMHKGKLFADIPVGYRRWMMEQPDWHKDIKYSLEKMRLV
jgi:DNA polymerase III epsilon subunit-like protein